MPKENNFTKAVKELLGDKEGAVPSSQPSISNTTTSTKVSKPVDDVKIAIETPVSKKPPVITQEDIISEETFINKDCIITGSIVLKTNLRNQGQIIGDITTKEDIIINGKVDGNLDCRNTTVSNGYVAGNITARADVCIDCNSIVVGDIVGDNFSADGKIKGNLKINNAVTLSGNAVICGNVSAKVLKVQDGATIEGNVQILSSKTTDDMFTIPKSNNKSSESTNKNA